jgi:hypothetical protein
VAQLRKRVVQRLRGVGIIQARTLGHRGAIEQPHDPRVRADLGQHVVEQQFGGFFDPKIGSCEPGQQMPSGFWLDRAEPIESPGQNDRRAGRRIAIGRIELEQDQSRCRAEQHCCRRVKGKLNPLDRSPGHGRGG